MDLVRIAMRLASSTVELSGTPKFTRLPDREIDISIPFIISGPIVEKILQSDVHSNPEPLTAEHMSLPGCEYKIEYSVENEDYISEGNDIFYDADIVIRSIDGVPISKEDDEKLKRAGLNDQIFKSIHSELIENYESQF